MNAEQLLNSHPFSQSFKNLDLKAFCCLLATPGCGDMIILKYKDVKGTEAHFGRTLKQPFYLVHTPNSKSQQKTWAKVTLPPLLRSMTTEEIESIKTNPLKVEYPCHSQSVEHAVATTSSCAKKYRKSETQVQAVLQTVGARADQPFKNVSHKRFREDIKCMITED